MPTLCCRRNATRRSPQAPGRCGLWTLGLQWPGSSVALGAPTFPTSIHQPPALRMILEKYFHHFSLSWSLSFLTWLTLLCAARLQGQGGSRESPAEEEEAAPLLVRGGIPEQLSPGTAGGARGDEVAGVEESKDLQGRSSLRLRRHQRRGGSVVGISRTWWRTVVGRWLMLVGSAASAPAVPEEGLILLRDRLGHFLQVCPGRTGCAGSGGEGGR